MSNLDFLQFVITYWKEIDECSDAIAQELEAYEGDHREMAFDYANCIADDKEEWSTYWVNKAADVIEEVTFQQCEETKLLLAPLGK